MVESVRPTKRPLLEFDGEKFGDSTCLFMLDVDDTLLDSRSTHRRAWEIALKMHGVDHDADFLRHQIGRTEIDALTSYRLPVGRTQAKSIADTKIRYAIQLAKNAQMFPDTLGFLRALGRLGFAHCLVTSSVRAVLCALLAPYPQLRELEATAVCGDEVELGKPHPEPLQTAMRKMGIDPENPRGRAVYVGDSLSSDGLAAARAGCRFIHLRRDLELQAPSVSRLTDILTVLGNEPFVMQ
jgi:beta-phosphoglucomutase-like phosphatase (HAD superfamily)